MTLQMYLKLGLKIKRINKILTFVQKDFARPFVEACAGFRREADEQGSKLRQRLFKNIPNATYGKTVERARDRSKFIDMFNQGASKPNDVVFFFILAEVVFVTNKKHLVDLAGHPNFIAARVLNPNLVMVFVRSKKCYFKRPYQVITDVQLKKKH